MFTVAVDSETSSATKGTTKLAGSREQFFRSPKYLTVSSQLHLEALAQSVGKVWALSPTFRAEKSDTPRHLSEFYMLEAEMSFTDGLDSVMDLVEDMLRHVAADLSGSRVVRELSARTTEGLEDMAPVDQVERRWKGLIQENWPRITYTEAINILTSAGEPFDHAPLWGNDLHSEHERYIAMKVGKGDTPVFVTHYPRDMKAFYMKASADPPQPQIHLARAGHDSARR